MRTASTRRTEDSCHIRVRVSSLSKNAGAGNGIREASNAVAIWENSPGDCPICGKRALTAPFICTTIVSRVRLDCRWAATAEVVVPQATPKVISSPNQSPISTAAERAAASNRFALEADGEVPATCTVTPKASCNVRESSLRESKGGDRLIRTMPRSRAACSIRETVERETPNRSATASIVAPCT